MFYYYFWKTLVKGGPIGYYLIFTKLLFLFQTDVEDVKFVVNYDYPSSSEDYVHRIGRTGRSQRTGTSYTFFTTGNARQAKDLISVLQEAKQTLNPRLLELCEMAKCGVFGKRNFFFLIYLFQYIQYQTYFDSFIC